MNHWEYKIQEFNGTGAELSKFLAPEGGKEWQLGALFPLQWTGDANELLEAMAAPANHVYLMFKRQIPAVKPAPSSLLS